MNWNQVKKRWPSVQEEVKRTWGRIDEADLAMIQGERELFTRILAQRYGYEEAEAQKKVDAFIKQLRLERESPGRLTWISQLLQKCWGQVRVASRR